MTIQQHNPLHPGTFLKRVYLDPYDIGSNDLSRRLFVSTASVSRLINAKMDISPAMALRLAKVLGRSPESWLLMQDNYNLHLVRQTIDLDALEPIQFAVKSGAHPQI
ncbi:MAG: HigA family addiction module antitoxin [Sedimenticola sp.]